MKNAYFLFHCTDINHYFLTALNQNKSVIKLFDNFLMNFTDFNELGCSVTENDKNNSSNGYVCTLYHIVVLFVIL